MRRLIQSIKAILVPTQVGMLLFAAVFVQISNALAEGESLKGMDTQQMQETFGQPDRVVTGTAGNERWHYGQSVVFVNQGRVVAWSDHGELSSRRNQTKVQRLIKQDSTEGQSSWVNSWTPADKADADEILDDLMR